ncbi:MAG: type I pullulanase [Chitinophagaceae bacterium]|nr:type I pullulanase [Chitinophagaceae bacterium]
MLFSILLTGAAFLSAEAQSDKEEYPEYTGKDLGLTYTPQQSSFRIWAPTASKVQLKLYAQPLGGTATQTINLKKAEQGSWTATLDGDHLGEYYTFSIKYKGDWLDEVPDPYAKAVGTNGKRGMIIDLAATNPPGWDKDVAPVLKSPNDAILYELHVRDASIDPSSGILHKGKFLGLTETGTRNRQGQLSGLDHLVELGVTHIHLLPVFDFNSVDESDTVKKQYNWGYDPLNFNTPEGSYATDAADGRVRIKEFKQLVKAFHDKGLSVVMDVVYNHTGLTERSNFNQLVPGYYYRHKPDGSFSDATACGNETASEKAMMRKFILESVLYWVNEYHVDGFRFDLMGVHDIETMNLISRELHKIKPGILLYGEGWTAGASPLPDSLRALKKNAAQLDRIAVFSDDIRDGLKGSVFEHADKGFVSNKPEMEESIKFGIVASCPHPQVDYSKVNYSKAPYAAGPWSTITYVECHDNHTLFDKLAISATTATAAERIEMQKLALTIVLTSQGIPFLHAGTEFLRGKKGVENSYKSPDSINAIDWNLKTINRDYYKYLFQLTRLRKAHPAFRMQTAEQIKDHIEFFNSGMKGVIGYKINGAAVGDNWKEIQLWFNGTNEEKTIPASLIGGTQSALLNNRIVMPVKMEKLVLKAFSCAILYKD